MLRKASFTLSSKRLRKKEEEITIICRTTIFPDTSNMQFLGMIKTRKFKILPKYICENSTKACLNSINLNACLLLSQW